MRFLLATGPGGAAFIMNAHHARFDGLACLRLFRAVAEQYSEAGRRSAAGTGAGLGFTGIDLGFRAAGAGGAGDSR